MLKMNLAKICANNYRKNQLESERNPLWEKKRPGFVCRSVFCMEYLLSHNKTPLFWSEDLIKQVRWGLFEECWEATE